MAMPMWLGLGPASTAADYRRVRRVAALAGRN